MEPRQAATVMLLRNCKGPGVEVFMLRRNLTLDFVGGAYVFPGGAVDPRDEAIALDGSLFGGSDNSCSAILELPAKGGSFWVAAIRECFEEAGILLASRSGKPLSFDDLAERVLFDGYRRALNAKESSFEAILRAEGLRLETEGVVYFSHWITPEGAPRRYDTRFFVAAAPDHQVGLHDNGETVANVWITPAEALERHRAGEFDLILPTIKHLEALSRYADVASALADARTFKNLPAITPRLVTDEEQMRVLLPGEDGYDEASTEGLRAGSPLPGRPGGPAIG